MFYSIKRAINFVIVKRKWLFFTETICSGKTEREAWQKFAKYYKFKE